MTRPDLRVHADPRALASALAQEAVQVLAALVDERRDTPHPVEVAVAGGFVATTVLPHLLSHVDLVDWTRVRIWWVDERFVPAGSPERNDEEAGRCALDALPGLATAPMPTDRGQKLEAARKDFLALWQREMVGRRLDLTVLGMGPDGHVASLFPGHPWTRMGASAPEVLAVEDSPKPPRQRLTLSMPVLLGSRHLWLAAAGAAKAPVLARALSGAAPQDLPVAALWSDEAPWHALRTTRCTVWTDAEALA
ncbi:6-phosphogluconolactonase [Schaalia sp. 19OD2882]|uniref:6-phosphogluconolactonase n=1 Tax=Schaalia sp. 19OD2882 TaxID=2794089 RepID=UPI001C1EBEAC|nr:6-phosphogluconolactonase [Schaalia sp. 19OD2882]QWW20540.1 6-phosphogluconolactonase [Schaalia sp. 19OD2882]